MLFPTANPSQTPNPQIAIVYDFTAVVAVTAAIAVAIFVINYADIGAYFATRIVIALFMMIEINLHHLRTFSTIHSM